MILYENTLGNFKLSQKEKKFTDYISNSFEAITGVKMAPFYRLSCKYLLDELYDAFSFDSVNNDCGIRLDVNISSSDATFVVIFTSKPKNSERYKTLIVVLPSWEKVKMADIEDMVYADRGDGLGFVRLIHPSYQAVAYKRIISKDNFDNMDFYAAAFLYDCPHDDETDIIENYKEEYINEAPVAYYGETLSEDYLEILQGGDGLKAIEEIHKRDKEIIASDVKELFDDQKYVVSSVIDDLKNNRNVWYIVRGQSGTGVTVVGGAVLIEADKLGKEVQIYENDPTFTPMSLSDTGVSMILTSEYVDAETFQSIYELAETKGIDVKEFKLNLNVGTSDSGHGLNFLARYLHLDDNIEIQYWNPEKFDILVVDNESQLMPENGYAIVVIPKTIYYDSENKHVLGSREDKIEVYNQMSYGTKGVKLYCEDKALNEYLKDKVTGAKSKYQWLKQLIDKRTISAEDIEQAQEQLLSNSEIREKLEKAIIGYMGKEAWDKITPEPQTYIISGILAYRDMKDYNQTLDFSGAVLQICKAVEIELTERFYFIYKNFLCDKYGDKAIEKAPYCMLTEEKPGKEREFLDKRDVSLGTIQYVVGLDTKGNIKNRYAYNEFEDYAMKKFLKDTSNIKQTLTNHLIWINKIKNDYRNKSAHTGFIDVVQAEDCINYVVTTIHKLGIMLDAYNY